MPRPKNRIPPYSHHKPTGQAYVRIPDGAGGRRTVYLGEFDSPESRAEYGRIVAELATSPTTAVQHSADPAALTVNEVLLVYLTFAERHYRRPDGTATNEYAEYKLIARYVRELYGHTPAASFGPLALKAVRQRFIDAGWCRRSVNDRIGRVRHVFKWAVGEELVPPSVHTALTAVAGLQKGRTSARESKPVGPVDDAAVLATLPLLNRHVRGLVEFQRLTGCRPGEACTVRRRDIETGGAVWLYRPVQHKNQWRGKPRTIAIGPRAQELLLEFFTPSLDDYLFSPARAVAELRAERAAKRKTPRYPSHVRRNVARRVRHPKRSPAGRYTTRSYSYAVARAVQKANRARKADVAGADFALVPHWHPNQLRHTFATRVRKGYGLEAAQVLLGHSKADVTQVYAERNEALAADIAVKIG
jgi:integrase